jgi:hypothetical protein
MPTAAQRPRELDGAAEQAAESKPPHDDALNGAFPSACADLSNDFLNHYSEALMLIEMAADDPVLGAELADWQPVSYRAYFASSDLRRAPAALAAYDALPEAPRRAFEKLVAAMDALATMATFALQPPTAPDSAAAVVEATVPALRGLIAKAGAFLNSGGRELASDSEAEGAQTVIDRIIGQAGSRPG